MKTIAITLNGQEVSGHPGMTILQLARESGVSIPTLCDDPNLAPYGACRICIVEDERTGSLLASCVTPIAPGMTINTESPKVLNHRKMIIRLMLASHPDSCMICDKGNRCELRRIASACGIGAVGLQKIAQSSQTEDVNPFLERDLSKCILCAKCIRACQELVVEGVIDYIGRGFLSKPATLNLKPLEESDCTFCGVCAAICPTGALTEKGKSFRGTSTKSVPTTCPFCGCGCGIILEVKDNYLIHSRPDVNSPVSHGTLCVKGSFGYKLVHRPDRLTKPLVRVDGDLRETSWNDALDFAASKLAQIKAKYGPQSLAVLSSARCTNEEAYVLQRFARCVLRTNNIDNSSRLYSAATRFGLGWNLGLRGTTSLLRNLECSGVILVIGADVTSSAPVVGYALKRAVRHNGAKLIVVDPRRTKLCDFAHIWMRPRIGTDIALLNGLAKVIVSENLADEEFVARRTDNFEAFKQGLSQYTPEYVENITGVPSAELRRASILFATSHEASIVYGNGITQYPTGTDAVMALANLAMLTGNVGHGAGGIYALQTDCNGLGVADMGAIPSTLPGYQHPYGAEVIRRFTERWGMAPPSGTGLTVIEMIQQAEQGTIKGMYIVGENPIQSFPDSGLTRKALSSLEFLMVQDIFLTETARLANVVLPGVSFAEKEGTFTNFEGRVQRIRQALPPINSNPLDWEIFSLLAKKMGYPLPYKTLQDIMDEIEEMVPLYQGIGYADAHMKPIYRTEPEETITGSRRFQKDNSPAGFGRFSPVQYTPYTETSTDKYPFTLVTGAHLFHWCNGPMVSGVTHFYRFSSEHFVEVNPSDAKRLGIDNGSSVRIASKSGSITATAMVTDNIPEGALFMTVTDHSSPIASLFSIVLDPKSKTPSLQACAVRLERAEADESA